MTQAQLTSTDQTHARLTDQVAQAMQRAQVAIIERDAVSRR